MFSKYDQRTSIIHTSLLTLVADTAVKRHDGGDDSIDLLRRLGLGGLDVLCRISINHNISRHPPQDRIAAVDDLAFHQELVEPLCWWRHNRRNRRTPPAPFSVQPVFFFQFPTRDSSISSWQRRRISTLFEQFLWDLFGAYQRSDSIGLRENPPRSITPGRVALCYNLFLLARF